MKVSRLLCVNCRTSSSIKGKTVIHSRVKNCGFVTNLWLTKFDGLYCTLGYFKQNELPRRFLKSGESSVEPKV